jgi:hypothetical protein
MLILVISFPTLIWGYVDLGVKLGVSLGLALDWALLAGGLP